ncbi:MAG: hypothetical protein ACOCV2_10620 [Persicimonas sp.]
MQPHRIEELKKRADRALKDGRVDANTEAELIEVLTPDVHEQTWPPIEVVLHVAEHPALADQTLPEGLKKALIEAFSAVSPLLGVRTFGTLESVAGRARSALESERNKFEMVSTRLGGEREEDVALVSRYLQTDPAPLFVEKLRRRAPEVVEAAEADDGIDARLDRLVEKSTLLEALEDPAAADPDDVRSALADLSDRVDGLALRRALDQGTDDQKLVAAALAAFTERAELAPSILEEVLAGSERAPQMAVLAASMTPLMARNVFAQFLAEAAWGNPEEPEAEITAERVHAIVAARCALPRAGSPLDEITDERLPASFDAEQLRRVPARVAAMGELWDAVESG